MFISIEELSTAMEAAGIDLKAIEKIREIGKNKGKSYVEFDDGEIEKLAVKIAKSNNKDEIKKEIVQKCKTFRTNAKDLLIIVVLTMVLAAALGVVFGFGSSLLGSDKSTNEAINPEMATA